MAINLENRVGEITLALSDKGVRANVLVREEGLGKKKQQLHITVMGADEEEGKRISAKIGETMLEKIGYGTCSSNYQNGTLEVKYTPLEEKDTSDKKYQITPGAQ